MYNPDSDTARKFYRERPYLTRLLKEISMRDRQWREWLDSDAYVIFDWGWLGSVVGEIDSLLADPNIPYYTVADIAEYDVTGIGEARDLLTSIRDWAAAKKGNG